MVVVNKTNNCVKIQNNGVFSNIWRRSVGNSSKYGQKWRVARQFRYEKNKCRQAFSATKDSELALGKALPNTKTIVVRTRVISESPTARKDLPEG